MKDILIIHYGELGLKGKNRGYFEGRLRKDIHTRLVPEQASSVRVESGRLVAELNPGFNEEAVRAHLGQVFGVAWYAFARLLERNMDTLTGECVRLARAHAGVKTFKIFCRRSDKTYPLTSQEICNRLGQAVVDQCGFKVDLDHHALPIHVDIWPEGACVYAGKIEGLKGMPRGTSGKMLCLFSGGIDSPVAAWMMMRRGARVQLLHFHPFRSSEEVVGSKITELHKQLKIFSPTCRLYLLPHYRYQVEASLKVPPAYETVVFRRFMFRAAEELARRRHFQALVTGDSLGQVASQTLENLAAAQSGIGLPIFSPLIARDKQEVVGLAEKIGTFATSIQAYKDCCSLMSRKPKTNVSVEEARKIEQELDMPCLVRETLELLTVWDGETLTPVPTSV